MTRPLHRVLLALALPLAAGLLATGGCSKGREEAVIARVDGTHITREELRRAVDRVLGERTAAIDDSVRRTVLESLVLNRAIARRAEKELTEDEKRLLDIEVRAHREQILTRMYIARHAPGDAVTEQSIRRYYDEHAAFFGAKRLREYEMIATVGELDAAQRTQLLAELPRLANRDDWSEQARALAARKLPVQSRRGTDTALLHTRLQGAIAAMAVGGAAQVVLAEGRPYLVRVLREVQQPPRPLAEVRKDIVQALVALQMKQSLKAASVDVLKDAEVEYLELAKERE